ncbi:MAG: response regulator transcription factor [Spirochaetes bacterium]|nr:response regulator transcription factor [Spirochaetota bacterium]
MKTVIQLLYTMAFSLGVAGVFLTLYSFLKKRSNGTRFFLLSLGFFTLHTAAILVSYYFDAADDAAGAGMIVPRVNRYLFAVSICLISCAIFLWVRCRFRVRQTRFKRALYGVAIFLVPQLLFSSSRFDVASGGRAGLDFFWLVAITVAVCTAARLAVRPVKGEKKRRSAVSRFLLIGTCALIAGQLADMYLTLSGFFSGLFFSVFGYAGLGAATIVAVFHHSRRDSSFSGAFIRNLAIGGISRREREIIDLIVNAYPNRRIAETLFISVSTVKSHTASIYRKLGINSRMELFYMCRKEPAKQDPENNALL